MSACISDYRYCPYDNLVKVLQKFKKSPRARALKLIKVVVVSFMGTGYMIQTIIN